jgi:hypothetical protein
LQKLPLLLYLFYCSDCLVTLCLLHCLPFNSIPIPSASILSKNTPICLALPCSFHHSSSAIQFIQCHFISSFIQCHPVHPVPFHFIFIRSIKSQAKFPCLKILVIFHCLPLPKLLFSTALFIQCCGSPGQNFLALKHLSFFTACHVQICFSALPISSSAAGALAKSFLPKKHLSFFHCMQKSQNSMRFYLVQLRHCTRVFYPEKCL